MLDGNCEDAMSILIDAHNTLRTTIGTDPCPGENKEGGLYTTGMNSMDCIMGESPRLDLQHCGALRTAKHHTEAKQEAILQCSEECKGEPNHRQRRSDLDPRYSFYTQPILLPRNMPNVRYGSHITVCLAAMFNLALGHHIFALSRCLPGTDKREMYLRKALKLYSVVYQLHYSEEISNEAFGNPVCSRNALLLALMTNSGYIHSLLGESERAQNCYRHLFASLTWLRSTHWWESRRPNEKERDKDLFAIFFEITSTWLEEQSLTEQVAAAA